TSPAGRRYALDDLMTLPRPLPTHVPIMIGGSGERKTLRTVAKYADMWNAGGTPEVLRHKDEVLRQHCEEVGRDQAQIERTLGLKPIIWNTPQEARGGGEEMREFNR